MPVYRSNTERLESILKECIETFIEKEVEYGQDDSGFEFIAAFEDRNSIEVCFTTFMKHIDVLRMWKKTPEKLPLKVLRHRIVDAVNYLALLEDEWERNLKVPNEPY
jgi:hypothetical protein